MSKTWVIMKFRRFAHFTTETLYFYLYKKFFGSIKSNIKKKIFYKYAIVNRINIFASLFSIVKIIYFDLFQFLIFYVEANLSFDFFLPLTSLSNSSLKWPKFETLESFFTQYRSTPHTPSF